MLEKDERVQKLEQWCQALIDNFRGEYEKLDELERKQLFVSTQYLSPCQIEIFWVSEPSVYQLFVFLHDSDRPDKEIKINGPFKGYELEKEVIKIMDESRWKKVIPSQEYLHSAWGVDVGTQLDKYSDAFAPNFLNFLNMIRNDALMDFKNRLISSHGMLSDGWIATFRGNAANLGYFEQNITESLENAKHRAASIRNGTVSKILQPQSIKDDRPLVRVIGAYYYPGVFIGDNVELDFKERLHGPNHIEYPKYEFGFTFNNRNVYCDKYGIVLVQIENEKRAIKILNTVFGVSLIFGVKSFPVRKSDLISSEMITDIPVLGDSIGGCSWDSHNKRFEPMNFMGPRKTEISLDKINDIIKIAEIIDRNQKLNDSLHFLLESYAHMDSFELSQSFMFSWFIVERHISQLFVSVGSKKKYTIATKIKKLNDSGIIDDNEYGFLIKYKDIRNNLIHTGKTIAEYESTRLFEFSRDIIKNEINQILKDEELKEI